MYELYVFKIDMSSAEVHWNSELGFFMVPVPAGPAKNVRPEPNFVEQFA